MCAFIAIRRQNTAFLLNNYSLIGSVRWESKSPAQSQKGNRGKPIIYALYCVPGERVRERTVLGTQKHIRYHPGLNVALSPRDKSLYSLSSGIVYLTIEKFKPNEKSHFVKQFYANPVRPLYKKYIHVLNDRPPLQFKLIDII